MRIRLQKRVRALCAGLCALLLPIGCAPYRDALTGNTYAYLGRPMQAKASAHAELSYADMPFSVPDTDALFTDAAALMQSIEAGADPIEAQTALDALYDALTEAETMGALAYVRYCTDVTDPLRKQAYETISAGLERAYGVLVKASLALSEKRELKDRYDADTVAALRAAALLYDPALVSLFETDRAQIGAYDALQAAFSIEWEGETWTRERILSDEELPFFRWYELFTAFSSAYALAAADLYAQMVQNRNAIARALGFSDFAAYRYAVYERDYTPKQAEAFGATVRTHLVPLYRDLCERTAADRDVLFLADRYEQGETMARLERTLCAVWPKLREPWTYMLRNGLYDVSDGPNRQSGSFTTFFPAYRAPFLFSTWEDSSEMPTTILHEFGHFACYYFRSERGDASGGSLDLAEIDSQGLELLAVPHYALLYGNRAGEARDVRLCDTLYAIVSGCALDAFEQYAYRNETASPEQLNAYFAELAGAYGLDSIGFTGTTWTEIAHPFRAPFYYISYATSAAVALELYGLCLESPARALTAYRTLLRRPAGSTFCASLQNSYLTDPLEDDTISMLCERLAAISEKGRNLE